jgi:hypothetical protein
LPISQAVASLLFSHCCRLEANTFGTSLHTELWKQQKQLLAQEADKLLQDSTACSNTPETYGAFLHVNNQPGAFEHATEALWNAVSITDTPSPRTGSKRHQESQPLCTPQPKRSCMWEPVEPNYEPDGWDGADYYEPDGDEGDEGADFDEEAELLGIWLEMYAGEDGFEGWHDADDDGGDGYWGYGGCCEDGDVDWEGDPEGEGGSDVEDATQQQQQQRDRRQVSSVPAVAAPAVRPGSVQAAGGARQQQQQQQVQVIKQEAAVAAAAAP